MAVVLCFGVAEGEGGVGEDGERRRRKCEVAAVTRGAHISDGQTQ